MKIKVNYYSADTHGEKIELDLSGVNEGEVLDQIGISEVVNHFSEVDLIAAIGEEKIKEFFGIELE